MWRGFLGWRGIPLFIFSALHSFAISWEFDSKEAICKSRGLENSTKRGSWRAPTNATCLSSPLVSLLPSYLEAQLWEVVAVPSHVCLGELFNLIMQD